MHEWLGIGSIARQTGLTPDTLRNWERRYGFPWPDRSAGGTRHYSPETLDQLLAVSRLIDQGERPGRAISQLQSARQDHRPGEAESAPDRDTGTALDARWIHEPKTFAAALDQALTTQDPATFIEQTAAPLMIEIGQAWARGEIDIYAEHGLSVLMNERVRQARARIPQPGAQSLRVLLITPPGEQHLLGPAMAACLIETAGARCLECGTGLPAPEAAKARVDWAADVIAVSASCAGSIRVLEAFLAQLRNLNPGVPLWLGGQGAIRLHRLPPGCVHLDTLEDIRRALQSASTDSHSLRP